MRVRDTRQAVLGVRWGAGYVCCVIRTCRLLMGKCPPICPTLNAINKSNNMFHFMLYNNRYADTYTVNSTSVFNMSPLYWRGRRKERKPSVAKVHAITNGQNNWQTNSWALCLFSLTLKIHQIERLCLVVQQIFAMPNFQCRRVVKRERETGSGQTQMKRAGVDMLSLLLSSNAVCDRKTITFKLSIVNVVCVSMVFAVYEVIYFPSNCSVFH